MRFQIVNHIPRVITTVTIRRMVRWVINRPEHLWMDNRDAVIIVNRGNRVSVLGLSSSRTTRNTLVRIPPILTRDVFFCLVCQFQALYLERGTGNRIEGLEVFRLPIGKEFIDNEVALLAE